MVIKILKEIDFSAPKNEINFIKEATNRITELINRKIKRERIKAEAFVGGSFAKSTIIKDNVYDVDIFIRFDWKYEEISLHLEKILAEVSKHDHLKMEKVHGSRDYFRIYTKNKPELVFEIIPVYKIKNPKEARNVTDLSYFHVNYIKKKIKNKKLAKEIMLAKVFCKSQGVYGAESYIKGFSGYALECLIIHFKTFENMLRKLVKVNERLMIDSEKKFKDKSEIVFSLNEAKLKSPVILIDPTWKERNVLAALSGETFEKFKNVAKKFLKKPEKEYFTIKKGDNKFNSLKIAKGEEILAINLETDRQEGDIAGTKMKKFADFLLFELNKYFSVKDRDFIYIMGKKASAHYLVRSKGEIIKFGPPVSLKKHAENFKKENKNIYIKSGKLYSKIKINFGVYEFIRKYIKENREKIKEMGITKIDIL